MSVASVQFFLFNRLDIMIDTNTLIENLFLGKHSNLSYKFISTLQRILLRILQLTPSPLCCSPCCFCCFRSFIIFPLRQYKVLRAILKFFSLRQKPCCCSGPPLTNKSFNCNFQFDIIREFRIAGGWQSVPTPFFFVFCN